MAATFTYAAVYHVDAVCQTPLRTGGTDGDMETVLRDCAGTAFLQGSSLAGALKEWLSSVDHVTTESLFGSRQRGGHLIVSDGVFDTDAGQEIRPRLRICGKSGCADQGGKFDVAQINRGSKMRFTLTWLGTLAEAPELQAVEEMLSALHQGEIRLGAQKSNGFGQVKLSVRKRILDMHKAEDRVAWLTDQVDGEPVNLTLVKNTDRVVFTLSGNVSHMLVKSSSTEQDGDGSYTPNLREGGRAVLPGSSVKGVVRARAEAVAEFIGLKSTFTEALFGRGASASDDGKQGEVKFKDILLDQEKPYRQSRIRIDRFTGGVMRGGLFCEEPVSGALRTQITVPNHPAACGLMLYVLRDLGLGLYTLGSGGGIGRGYLNLERVEAAVPGKRNAALLFHKQEVVESNDPDGVFGEWLNALEEVRHEV